MTSLLKPGNMTKFGILTKTCTTLQFSIISTFKSLYNIFNHTTNEHQYIICPQNKSQIKDTWGQKQLKDGNHRNL